MVNDIADTVRLNDGRTMPGYGFGCYKAHGDELVAALDMAHACGYRMIDTAAFYENEETVGAALKRLPPVYLVSKIWPTSFANPVRALDASLKKLQRDILNGYLLHWPGRDERAMLSAWEKLLREQEKGKIGTLGVSNFEICHLEALHRSFGHWPAVNQIEVHPAFQHRDLCQFCHAHAIAITAWAPLGRGRGVENATLEDIGKATGKSAAQVILRWHIQEDRIAIPKSVHAQRIAANSNVFDFSLTDAQMAAIDALEIPNQGGRTGKDPMLWP